jgi:DNA-binding winged helix-turn-helix (wHTH) protein/Tol biopolymer transport system component
MTNGKAFVFRFSGVEVRQREFCLVKNGEVLAVEPKAFRLLLYLLEHPQKLISKEELLDAVWGDASVTENSLTQNIAKLRRLLEDDARNPRFIETVATVGYRLVCAVEVGEQFEDFRNHSGEADGDRKAGLRESSPNSVVRVVVEPLAASEAPLAPAVEAEAGKGRRRIGIWSWVFAGAAVVVAGLGAAVWDLHRPLPLPHVTAYTQMTHDGTNKGVGGTDGNRLFINEFPLDVLGQVSVTGRELTPLPLPVRHWADLWDVSPDGTSFLLSRNEDKTPYKILWNVTTPGGPAIRIGLAKAGAFSPDGKMIAYCTPEGDVYLVQSDGTGPRKIASAPTRTFNIASLTDSIVWSPDGKSLRFVRDKEYWEVSSTGANLHQLLPGWNTWQGSGRWTPNGHFFIFMGGGPSPQESELYAIDERRGLLRKPPTAPTQLTVGPVQWGVPVPGRDGKTIFVDGNFPRGELLRQDPQTGKYQPFLGGISAQFVTFSPDGKSVAYVTHPEGVLWKADRDGRNPIQLSLPPIMAFLPHWSPDGSRILFEDVAKGLDLAEIYLVSTDGGSPRRLFPESKESSSDADWSPDGNSIVFEEPPGWNANSVVRVLDTKTNRVTTLPGSVGLYWPLWSPDGRFIAATSSLDGRSLSVFDTRTQRWSKIFDLPGIEFLTESEWSRDGKVIYARDIAGSLYRIPVSGGKAESVGNLQDSRAAIWTGLDSTTDAPLILRDVGTDDIYALTLSEK